MDFTQMLIEDLRAHGGQVTKGPDRVIPMIVLERIE